MIQLRKKNALKLNDALFQMVLSLTAVLRRHPARRTQTARPLDRALPHSWAKQSRMALCAAVFVVLLAGCTGRQGLSGDSNGWSPASVSGAVQISQASISEAFTFTESDSTLTVTEGARFSVGQTLVIESEHLAVISISGNDLGVVRGANGTTPQPHSDGTPVFILSEDVVTIYVGTKQGELKALKDDGFGPPSTKWTFRPLDTSQ